MRRTSAAAVLSADMTFVRSCVMIARVVRCTVAGQKDKRQTTTWGKESWWSVTGEAL
jgi:hypothetical protein